MKDTIDNKVIEEYGNAAKKILKIIYDEKNQELLKNEAKAFSETYDIIMNIDYHIRKNIPNSFMEILLKKRDINIKVDIDYDKNILDQVTDETKVILAIIYKKYILNINQDIVSENKNTLNSENVNENTTRKKIKQEEIENNMNTEKAMIEYKKSNFFKKIFDKIKFLLKR